jgi:putative glutamine amidotransferase
MSEPPTIGLLVGREPDHRYSLHRGYVDAVIRAGGLPVVAAAGPGVDPRLLAAWAPTCAGLVATGGGDVDPARYGGPPRADLKGVDPERDAGELAALVAAREAGRPVLGICRGIQLLAVAAGGSLIPDLVEAGYADHWQEERQYETVHELKVQAGSRAERSIGSATGVNSIHHQGVADPGDGLAVTAWAPDGLIEAMEGPGVLAVQWHPERLVGTDPRHLAPFHWLLDAGR